MTFNDPNLAIVEELPPSENEIAKVMWICRRGHHGTTVVGYRVYCPTCCHGETVPAGFTCSRCGAQ